MLKSKDKHLTLDVLIKSWIKSICFIEHKEAVDTYSSVGGPVGELESGRPGGSDLKVHTKVPISAGLLLFQRPGGEK